MIIQAQLRELNIDVVVQAVTSVEWLYLVEHKVIILIRKDQNSFLVADVHDVDQFTLISDFEVTHTLWYSSWGLILYFVDVSVINFRPFTDNQVVFGDTNFPLNPFLVRWFKNLF